jgi:hypothetical protein
MDFAGLTPKETSVLVSDRNAYSSSDFIAYVRKDSSLRQFVHEYFGHGLFFEYHPVGQLLHFLNQESKLVYDEGLVFTLNVFNSVFEDEIEVIASRITGELL